MISTIPSMRTKYCIMNSSVNDLLFQHLSGGLDERLTANPTLYPGRALVLPYPVGIAILRVETIKRREGQDGVKKKISKHSSHQASGIRLQYGL